MDRPNKSLTERLVDAQVKASEAKKLGCLTRADIISYVKAIREMVHLDPAVEIALEMVRRAEDEARR